MNDFILVVPILFIRFGLLSALSREAVKRAAFYPPTEGMERLAYWVYQITTLSMLIILIFTKTRLIGLLSFIGLGIYILGAIYKGQVLQKTRRKGVKNMDGLDSFLRMLCRKRTV